MSENKESSKTTIGSMEFQEADDLLNIKNLVMGTSKN